MYAHRIQLTNYGPIDHLDIKFPFGGEDKPKPVVLVGENGSGKSILLSHIVNGLVGAKNTAYPRSLETEAGTVFKVRSGSYIKSGRAAYFARVDFSGGMFISEAQVSRGKRADDSVPSGLVTEDAISLWNDIKPHQSDALKVSLPRSSLVSSSSEPDLYSGLFASRCVLYFPANRFDEPAWLNPTGFNTETTYGLGHMRIEDTTPRKVVVSSMVSDLREWLLDVTLDTVINDSIDAQSAAAEVIPAAKQVMGAVLGHDNPRILVGPRGNRTVGVDISAQQQVRTLAHLSSGETALIGLFLSIIRDYDLCDRPQVVIPEIRGIVVVDEIDLHLHVRHQREVLPRLIEMFPKVQFIVTTHSPLFVLGMANTFGNDGFDIYRLPDGQKISAEEFSEFGKAYEAFATSSQFAADVQQRVTNAQKPMLWVEGPTDEQYLRAAAVQLDRLTLLDRFELRSAGGKGNLANIWTALDKLTNGPAGELIRQVVVLLHDPEYQGSPVNNGHVYKQKMPGQSQHPISKGIENLFSKDTLDKARQYKRAFVDISGVQSVVERGKEQTIPEKWSVNPHEKKNLCDWLCESGNKHDFQHFEGIFEILEEVLQQTNNRDASAQ